jgi:hypothetical protein
MDEFEVELRITQLEKAYQIASNALHRARITLQVVRSDATSTPELIARAERRCEELVRRKEGLRATLDEFEAQAVPAPRTRPARLTSVLRVATAADGSD